MTTKDDHTNISTRIAEVSDKIARNKDKAQSEAATISALVNPFLRDVLGIDLDDLDQLIPERPADLGSGREKVDYAVMKNGRPIMLVECKQFGTNLTTNGHDQLHRYFHVTDSARIAILTDGVTYRFYSDLCSPNKMDDQPFHVLNMLSPKSHDEDLLTTISYANFNTDSVVGNALERRTVQAVLAVVESDMTNPHPKYLSYLASRCNEGRSNAALDRLARAVKTVARMRHTENDHPTHTEHATEPQSTDPQQPLLTGTTTQRRKNPPRTIPFSMFGMEQVAGAKNELGKLIIDELEARSPGRIKDLYAHPDARWIVAPPDSTDPFGKHHSPRALNCGWKMHNVWGHEEVIPRLKLICEIYNVKFGEDVIVNLPRMDGEERNA